MLATRALAPSSTIGDNMEKLTSLFIGTVFVLLVTSVTVAVTLVLAYFSLNIFFEIHNMIYGY